MDVMDDDLLAARFEAQRSQLRAMAYRMLGSLSDADDAVQEGWVRLSRTGPAGIDNLGGWLTTVVARVCLDMLRARRSRREDALDDVRLPDPIVGPEPGLDPESQALLADSVGMALLVVLDTLAPEQRLAFVLHDVFAISFEQIAPIVGRTPAAARQLASRARRRVQGAVPGPDAVDLRQQRQVTEAFMAAARGGDLEALLQLLDPEIVLRVDFGAAPAGVPLVVHGARNVAGRALLFARSSQGGRFAVVNGGAGAITVQDGTLVAVMSLRIEAGRVAAMYVLADPERLRGLEFSS